MSAFNLSATLNIFRVLRNPSLLYPHMTINTFNQLPIPLTVSVPFGNSGIRAIVLDKDNCFAAAQASSVYPAYNSAFEMLKLAYPGDRLVIVSNSAGTNDDPGHKEAKALEKSTGIKVFRHTTKKPGCFPEVLEHLRRHAGVTSPNQVAVVGDRLFTDVLMAGLMGSYVVWVRHGVEKPSGRLYGVVENAVMNTLKNRGYVPLSPSSNQL